MAYYPTWPIGYAVVSSPCRTACSTKKTDWRASETDRRAPEPREEGKTTFADEKDPFNANKPPQPAEEVTPMKPEKATAASEEGADGKATAATEGGSIKDRAKKDGWSETSEKKPAEGEEKAPGETGGEATKPAEASGGDEKAAGTEAAGTPAEKPAEETEGADVVAPKVEKPAEESSSTEEEKKAPLLGDEVEDKTNFGKNTREGEENPAGEGEGKSAEAEGEDGDAAKPAEGGETKPLEVKPLEEIQDKSSWKFSRPARRIAFRASFGNVKITRVAQSVKTDYVIPAASLTRIAER